MKIRVVISATSKQRAKSLVEQLFSTDDEVEIIDPIELFINRDEIKQNFLEDKIHYTQRGNHLLAEEIYKKLSKIFKK